MLSKNSDTIVVFFVRITIFFGSISDKIFAPPHEELKNMIYKALIGKGAFNSDQVRDRIKRKASIGLVVNILKELTSEGYVERQVIPIHGTEYVKVVYRLTDKRRVM